MNRSAIQEALVPLVGLPLRNIGRAANMVFLDFGEMRETQDRRGGTTTVSDWTIHVQCPWRVCRQGNIVVAYYDLYRTPAGDVISGDSLSGSQFDAVTADLCMEFQTAPLIVASIVVDDVGGFTLCLAGDYRIDVFPADSHAANEHWRVFRPGTGLKHFVFRDPGIRAI